MIMAERYSNPYLKSLYTLLSPFILQPSCYLFTYASLMLIRIVGVLSSALARHLLLVGQGCSSLLNNRYIFLNRPFSQEHFYLVQSVWMAIHSMLVPIPINGIAL